MGRLNALGQCSNLTNSRYIVSLRHRLQDGESPAFLEKNGLRHVETFQFPEESFPDFGGDMVLVESSTDLSASALNALAADPRVEFAEPDLEIELETVGREPVGTLHERIPSQGPTRTPNDLDEYLWNLDNRWGYEADIDAPQAWAKTVGENGPIIAVLDTGVALEHPDLKENLWVNTGEIPNNGIDDDGNGVVDDVHGYDAYNDDGDPDDKHSHGTHCAGTIGAVGNNNLGVVGVNWQAQIMPIKIFNDDPEKPGTKRSAILRGISYATKNGARVTSNSWGGGRRSRSVEKAFKKSGAFHMMAAGNERTDNDKKAHYPSSYDIPNSLSVASTDHKGYLSWFSNYGKESVDLAAPGSAILSTVLDGNYDSKSGTSMATPHVSGVAGLLLSVEPELSNEELKDAILGSVVTDPRLSEAVASGGTLNANKALETLS